MPNLEKPLSVRDAVEADIPALTGIKGAGSETVHSRRLREAKAGDVRYLVVQLGQEPVGFGVLVLRRPDEDSHNLPEVNDLRIKDTLRGQGYGTALLSAMEQIARAYGFRKIYLQVEPVNNPRAYALYQRLGYQAEQTQPRAIAWEYVDSAGKVVRGEEWVIDMVKQLDCVQK